LDPSALLIKTTLVFSGAYLLFFAQKFNPVQPFTRQNDDGIIANLTKEITGRDNLLNESRKQYAELSQAHANSQAIASSLEQSQGQIQTIQKQLKEAEDKLQSADQEIASFKDGSQIKQFRAQFEEKKQEVIELKKSLFAAEGEIEMLYRRLSDEKELKETKDFNSAKDFCAQLSSELENLIQEKQLLEDIIARVSTGQSKNQLHDLTTTSSKTKKTAESRSVESLDLFSHNP